MTVSIGNIIYASDYNTLRSEVNQWFGDPNPSMTFGNGSQSQGWGGSMDAVVNIGNDIEAAHYNSLADRCNIGEDIVNGVSGIVPQVVVGTDIEAADHNAIETKSDSIFTNRNNIEALELELLAGGSTARSALYSTSVACIFTYTFSSFAQARYFFNSGGALNISGIITGYTFGWGYDGEGVDQALTTMGTVTMDYTSTTGGGTPAASVGFYDLTATFQTINTATGVGAYTNTIVVVSAQYRSGGAIVDLALTIFPDPAPRTVDGTTTITTGFRKLYDQSSGGASLLVTSPVYSLTQALI